MNHARKHFVQFVQVTDFLTVSSMHECIACWKCVEACPRGVLGKVNFLWHKHAKLSNPGNCIGCGKCAAVCLQSIFSLNKKTR